MPLYPIPLLHNRPAPTRETGAAWFERQPEAARRALLGPSAFALYQAGQIQLSDLMGMHDDPTWGPRVYRRSLRELARLGVAEGRRRREPGGSSGDDPAPPKPFVAPSKRAMKQVRAEEDRIRLQAFETVYVVDNHGNVLLQRDGNADAVVVYRRELDMMRGRAGVVFTHNHPAGLGKIVLCQGCADCVYWTSL